MSPDEETPVPPISAPEPAASINTINGPVQGPVITDPPDDELDVSISLAQSGATQPELLADSLGDYLRGWRDRIKAGQSGALPILTGLVVIVIIFQVQNSKFLTAGNLVNLFVQATVFILFGLAEIFALLLSEIDLSAGYVAAVGAFIIAELIAAPYAWPWWAGIIVGLLITALIGALQGTLITRLRLPSFIVTLAGLLGWQGVMIWLADRTRRPWEGDHHQQLQPRLQARQRQHFPTDKLDHSDCRGGPVCRRDHPPGIPPPGQGTRVHRR